MNKKIYTKNNISFKNKGFTIVEVLVGCAIISVTVFALMISAQKSIEFSERSLKQTQADSLLEGGAEAVKSIRDNNWNSISSLSLNTNYYLYFDTSSNSWSLSSQEVTPPSSIPTYPIDGIFNRVVVVSPVYRNSDDDISDTGTLDVGTKKVGISVSWNSSVGTISKNLIFYVTNLFN